MASAWKSDTLMVRSDHVMDIELRPWSEEDFPLLVRLLGDPEMTRHLGGPESSDQLRNRHRRYLELGPAGHGAMFVVLAGPDRSPAGSVGYWEREGGDQVVWETGWSVLPEFQGMGVATAGTALAIESARMDGRHRYMHAYPEVDNAASNAICRKLGFTLVEVSDFEYPPGNVLRCNDWRLDLLGTSAKGER
jgi:RimJ/RimL family protein N-acetyltransferase